MNFYLVVGLVIAVVIIIYLISVLIRIKLQLNEIKDALEIIKKGNLNHRVLTRKGNITSQICYEINEIISESQLRLIQQKQSEKAYKQLMTNLSHDVKTPLASMIGYIEAIEMKMVDGEEKEQFFHVVYEKAEHLKEFVESLFEWVKIDSGEQIYHFQVIDINELSREIAAEWALILEQRNISYEFKIPEEECLISVDKNAYVRILNNLLQNIITHSEGTKVGFMISKATDWVKIVVWDNGRGISPEQIPHIFERMYRGDYSRNKGGNGLGLTIAKELTNAHGGTITVESKLGEGTKFIIMLPVEAKVK